MKQKFDLKKRSVEPVLYSYSLGKNIFKPKPTWIFFFPECFTVLFIIISGKSKCSEDVSLPYVTFFLKKKKGKKEEDWKLDIIL